MKEKFVQKMIYDEIFEKIEVIYLQNSIWPVNTFQSGLFQIEL